jgi:hypothetical protein
MATQFQDFPEGNPIFGGRDLILASTSYEQPAQRKRPKVPPAVGRIIGELGLRYRPSAQADLEAHAEALRLLSEDLHDVPPHLLEDAAKRWVRDNKFMPRASELVELARGQMKAATQGTDYALNQLEAHCERLNAMSGGRDGWRVVGQAPNRTIAKARECSEKRA